MPGRHYIPVDQYLHGLWPSDIVELPHVDALQHVWIEPLLVETDPDVEVSTAILFEGSAELGIPGLDAISLVIAPSGAQTTFMVRFTSAPTPTIALVDVPIALRFHGDLLKPARLGAPDANGVAAWEVDPTVPFLDITLAKVTISVDFDGNFGIETDLALELPPAMIGDTGVVIEAHDLGIFLDGSSPPPGRPAGWRGVHIGRAELHLPAGLSGSVGTLSLTDADIGNGGFSGGVAVDFAPPEAVSLLGMDVTLEHAGVTFVQNALTASELRGTVRLPFFDETVEVSIAIGLDGSLSVALGGGANGLVTLVKPGVLELHLDSLGFEVDGDRFLARMSGGLKPLVGGLDWPKVQVQDLTIDSDGNVKLPGGWLDLRDSYTLDLHGFQFELTKLGLGSSDDGGKWVGFSGGLKLVDGMQGGASVDGLRVTWYEDGRAPALTLDGVGVEMEIPGVLGFKGSVSYRELPGGVHRFDGDIRLRLETLELELDGQLVIGYDDVAESAFFAIYLGVELPAGIPLWTTGLGLYGLAGLLALDMEPDKAPAEPWYGIGPGEGWYKKPQIGVTDLRKWRNETGSSALGAGVTIGTVADNGFTFSGRLLLAIVFPGPVVFLEGKANILAERSKLDQDPMLRALAVIDGRAGTFDVGLDAKYAFAVAGEVIDIAASAEAFFDFNDPMAWHLYLGMRDPRERRIRAQIFFHIFEANAYFMLDAHSLATGAFVGYHRSWKFGPVSAKLEAWIEGNALVSFKPVHFHGDLWLHGAASLSVFGFGFDLGADAHVGADVFDPFAIKVELSVHLGLPWPLPDFDVDLTLEWGPEKDAPPLPLPLKEIAVEHFKVTTSWPLPRHGAQALLAPDYDPDGDGFLDAPSPALAVASAAPPPANAPVVPLDARPHVTFARTVHDDALVGVNPQPPLPDAQPDPGWEWIGDPALNQGPVRMRTGLQEVALERWEPASGAWVPVARKGPGANPPGVPALFGSWAPVPQLPGGGGSAGSPAPAGNTKLWLWSRSGFDYTRHATGTWNAWWSSMYPNYPCIERPPDERICCDFRGLEPGTVVTSPWRCPKHPELALGWAFPAVATVGGDDREPLLCFGADDTVELRLRRTVKDVEVFLVAQRGDKDTRTCVDFRDRRAQRLENPYAEGPFVFETLRGGGGRAEVNQLWQRTLPDGTTLAGLDVGVQQRIALAAPADAVRLLVSGNSPMEVTAFDAAGRVVARQTLHAGQQLDEIELQGKAPIAALETRTPGDETYLHQICAISVHRGVRVVGVDAGGQEGEPVPVAGGVAKLDGAGLAAVHISGERQGFCLRGFCVTVGVGRSDGVVLDGMAEHLTEETARWSETGFVLLPHTAYRIAVTTTLETRDFAYDAAFNTTRTQTELAYFRTTGPPGLAALSVPVNAPQPDEFASGLDDLVRYVAQTVPPTVPSPGQPPLLPRPVYRAYDVGVAFDEDYVDLLYRASGRDLGLYLFDNNDAPARDAFGRLLVTPNRWGRAETLQLTATDKDWLDTVNASTCVTIDEQLIVRSRTLGVDGQVLAPDTLYEARLIPLLLHETFDAFAVGQSAVGPGGTLPAVGGGWVVADAAGTSEGPSVWTVGEDGVPATRFIAQSSNIWGGPDVAADPTNPGTLLLRAPDPALPADHRDQPAQWTDYRLTAILRSGDDDALGLAVRHRGAGDHYLFALDRQRAYRRLVRVAGGVWTILAADAFVYPPDSDMTVSIEAIGERLRVYQDGALVFDVSDATHAAGGIGLYAWADQGARFADVRVDDFRAGAPAIYRFSFVTSRFTDLYDQWHSATEQTFRAPLGASAVDLSAAVPLAGAPAAVGDAEARAYMAVAEAALGAAAHADTARMEATAVTQGDATAALLVRTAEPVDWGRTAVTAALAAAPDGAAPGLTAPLDAVPASGDAVIADWSGAPAGVVEPIRESVTVLLREQQDPDGLRVEYRTLPSSEPPAAPDGTVFAASGFTAIAASSTADGDVLLKAPPDDLAGFTVLDPPVLGPPPSPSKWQSAGGVVTQSGTVGTVTAGPSAAFALPGTLLLGGDAAWRDVAVAVTLRTDVPAGAVGVAFRVAGRHDFYRFSADPSVPYRRLVKCTGGVFTVLWEDAESIGVGVDHGLRIEADGTDLRVLLDGTELCAVHDTDHLAGRIALYAWRCKGAVFTGLSVLARVTSLPGWEVVDRGPLAARSEWTSEGGALTQTADQAGAGPVDPLARGSFAVCDDPVRTDVRVRVRLELDALAAGPGAIGVAVRWQGPDDHLLLVLDAANGTRQLVRRQSGVVTQLWGDGTAPPVGAWRDVVVEAIGSRVRVTLDGTELADVHDPAFADGRVALFACGHGGARFARFSIESATPAWLPWGAISGVGTLAAGRRVRLLAGREGDSTVAPTTAEIRRFLGFAPGDPAGVRLPAEGVDLRLLAADGTVLHARRFAPDAAFAPLPVRVLRAADGTGLLLTLPDAAGPAGTRLAPGTYRLAWTFRRDNSAADPASAILRESGDAVPEQGRLDLRVP